MSAESLQELLVEEIKDLYNAENQLVKALSKMAKAATNPDLKQSFLDHLGETKEHVVRLKKVFKLLGAPVRGKTCPAMQGLIEEGSEGIKENDEGPVRDALLIGAAQRVEHYEIAAYGTVRAFAEQLGLEQVVDLLQETLDEEGETDKKLAALAVTVNSEAMSEV